MQWNIPNILTVIRMIAAPMVGLVYVFLPRPIADWTAMVLFIAAALTDYIDGYLARQWQQVSAFGRMLDPIADKAIVVISLAVIMALSGLNPWILIPISFIIYREIFVSGLREFLGKDATRLRVTRLAKWKTMAQMVAIPALFLTAIYEWDYLLIYNQIGPETEYRIIEHGAPDEFGLRDAAWWFWLFHTIGVITLWLAAILTLVTGFDYFRKAMPYLREDGEAS